MTEPATRPATIHGQWMQIVRRQRRNDGQEHADGGNQIALPGGGGLAEHLQSEDKEHGRDYVEQIDQ